MTKPFNAKKIAENVYWVGAIDWQLADFHGYKTERGTTYNAFLTADILDIQGMTPKIFSEISNLITVRSDQYRIKVIADSVEKVSSDTEFNEEKGDKVIARSVMDVIVDRSDLAQSAEDNGKAQFRVISKE